MTFEEYKKEYTRKTIFNWYIEDVVREKEGVKRKGIYFKARCLLCNQLFIVRSFAILNRKQGSCNKCRIQLEKNKMVGLKKKNNDGYEMEITRYENDEDMDIRFFNGEMVYNTNYRHFKDGSVKLPSELHKSLKEERLGETNNNKDGLEMKIYYYNSADDLGVLFTADNVKVDKRSYESFTKGSIQHPEIQRVRPKTLQDREARIGYEFTTVRGVKGIVIDYNDAMDCTVKLENNMVIENLEFKNVKKGQLPKEYKTTQLLGVKKYANNGVKMGITRIEDAHDIDVEFEDGSKVYNKTISAFYSGSISHPTIKRGKGKLSGKFLSFNISLAFRLNEPGKVFYFCECSKCGLQDILTPDKMLKHKCKEENTDE